MKSQTDIYIYVFRFRFFFSPRYVIYFLLFPDFDDGRWFFSLFFRDYFLLFPDFDDDDESNVCVRKKRKNLLWYF